jgi:dienelactone hydrolase
MGGTTHGDPRAHPIGQSVFVSMTRFRFVSGGHDVDGIRRSEVQSGDTVGVVFEPIESTGVAVVLGGSMGGVPEPFARRVAECGVTAFALGYFGATGLPSVLAEIPLELLVRGIELFRDEFASGAPVGLAGVSKGAELALVLAAELPHVIGPTVAVAPSCVAWYGLNFSDPSSMHRSSWTLHGEPVPFLPLAEGRMPDFTEHGMRTDSTYDLSCYTPAQVEAARIPIERARGPILLLAGDDDHMWPAATMSNELAGRMTAFGRSTELTSVVYPDAGHTFLTREFMPPPGSPSSPPIDFGGTVDADLLAAADAWARIGTFLADHSTAS